MNSTPSQRPPNSPPRGPGPLRRRPPRFPWWTVILLLILLSLLVYLPQQRIADITYDFFLKQIRQDNVSEVTIEGETATGQFRTPPLKSAAEGTLGSEGGDQGNRPASGKSSSAERLPERFRVVLPGSDEARSKLIDELIAHGARVRNTGAGTAVYLYYALMFLLPIVLLAWMWIMLRRSRDPTAPGGFLSGFTRSPARRYEATNEAVTFDDVAGIETVKAELEEIIEFLREPQKFQRLGARIPKGVLLNGPPGTGKTLLARAVAGEAGVPFFSVNGSEFIQMFVGVGAGRVRDLFRTAKAQAPAIIFIDEIDAVGRQRGAGLGGGHDEREQTLNQILSEMDGFTPADSVIVLAATNRPDVLDPALLRPGRFDRHITVDRPTRKGRLQIFKVHVRKVPLDNDVDLERMADATVGLTGADIRNIVNEAALWAARHNKTRVSMADLEYARDKVLMGPKREEILTGKEKRRTAYHEAAHTIAAWKLKGGNRVHKVSIIPRGRALGATQILPAEDRFSITQSEILDRLVVLLAGRAAERMVFGETTAGAENDLERATELARRMITHWGMSKTIGPVSVKLSEDDPFLGRELQRAHLVSDATLEKIDQEIRKWLIEADRQAQELLQQYRGELEQLVSALLKEEELIEAEIREILGAPLWQDQSDEGEGSETDTTQTHAGESSSASPRPAARASGAVPESEISPETTQPTERSPSKDSD